VTTVGNTGASTAGIFDSNAVSYSTPKMNGFDATVLYSLGGVSGNSSANSVTSFAAKYDGVKGLLISVGALQTKGATGSNGQNESSIGASYNVGAFTVAANYLDAKSTGVTPTVERTSTNFGGSYQINGNLKVMAGYYDVSIKNGGSLKTTAAMFDYSLSKRTGLYFGGQNAKNTNFGGAALDAGGVGSSTNNTTSTGFVAGIHSAF
jgi:predicted porin